MKDAVKAISVSIEKWESISLAEEIVSEHAESLLLLAVIEKRMENQLAAHNALTRALVISRRNGQTLLESRCWMQFAHIDYANAELDAANEKIRKALDLLAVGGHFPELVRTYYNAALLSAETGDRVLAMSQLDRALELMTTHGIEYGNGKVEQLLDELRSQVGVAQS